MKTFTSAGRDQGGWTARVTLAAALCLLAAGCGAREGGQGSPAETTTTPSPGATGLPGGTTESPNPTGNGATQAPPVEPGLPPEPGESTSIGFEILARGTDPVDERFTPKVLVARNPEEGEAAANSSPAPGAASYLRDWDDYGDRAVVAVLGGSQPDPAHRLVLRSINIIKAGTLLLASGKIARPEGAAQQVISMPWVVLAVDASAADAVQRCTLSLEGASPFTTSCK